MALASLRRCVAAPLARSVSTSATFTSTSTCKSVCESGIAVVASSRSIFSSARPLRSSVFSLPASSSSLIVHGAGLSRLLSSNSSISSATKESKFPGQPQVPSFQGREAAETDTWLDILKADYEEVGKQTSVPDEIKEFLKESPFKLESKTGDVAVRLKRKFKNEDVVIEFGLQPMVEGEPFEEDDQKQPPQEGGDEAAQQQGSSGDGGEANKVVDVKPDGSTDEPEGKKEEEDEPGTDAFDQEQIPFEVRVSKKDKDGNDAGTLVFACGVQQFQLLIHNVIFYRDSALATPKTVDHAEAREHVYHGPRINELDYVDQMGTFLEERGIDDKLLAFITLYFNFKEDKEYVNWCGEVAKFIEK